MTLERRSTRSAWTLLARLGLATTAISLMVAFAGPTASADPVPKELNNSVTSPEGGCPEGSTNPECTTKVGIEAMQIEKKADKTSAKPGETVTYTLTLKNTGTVPITGKSVTDDLSGVIDDATYQSATASAGITAFAPPTLTWTGDIAAGATVSITYTVKVNGPPSTGGDDKLGNVVTGPPGSNCEPGSSDPKCKTDTPIAAIKVKKAADATTAVEGDKVTYTITVTNTGEAAYRGAKFTDNLSDVLDDATYNNDQSADKGVVGYAAPLVTWTGDLAKGEVATITYSVTVK